MNALLERRGLPALVFALSLLAHGWWVLPGGPNGRTTAPRDLTWDEGTVLHESLRIAEGEVMYRDFFAFQGPVYSTLNAGVFAGFGFSMELAQAFSVLVNAVSALMLFLLLRRLGGQLLGFGLTLLFIATLVPMWPYSYPHWFALAFVHAGLWCVSLERSRAALVLGGALLGLSLWTIQSLGLAVLGGTSAALFAFTWQREGLRHAARAVALVIGGAMVVSVGWALAFARHGALGEMLWSMFEWPFAHYRGINTTEYAAFLGDHLDSNRSQPHVWRIVSQLGVVVIAALPLLGVAATLALLVRARRASVLTLSVTLGGAAAIAPLFLAGTRRDVVHLAFLASLALVALAAWAGTWALAARRRWLGLGVFGVGALVCTNHGWKTFRSETAPDRPRDFKAQWLDRFSWASRLDAEAVPGAFVLVGREGAAGISHLFTRTRNPTSFTYLPFEWRAHSDYLSAAQWQRAAKQLSAARPRLVIVDDEQWSRLTGAEPGLSDRYVTDGDLRRLKEP